MCIPGLDPITLLGIAGSIGGSIINNQAQNAAINEQNRQNQIAMERERSAREAEVGRQRQWEMSQAEEVTRALAEADPIDVAERSEERVADPENQIMAAADEYNVPVLQGQVQNEDVTENIGETIANQTSKTRELLRSAAMLQAQGGSMNDVAQALFGMGSEISNIGSNRRGSMNAARLETSVPAAQVTRSSSPIGDLLMLGGQALAGHGGQRAGMNVGNIYRPGMPLNAIPNLGPLNARMG